MTNSVAIHPRNSLLSRLRALATLLLLAVSGLLTACGGSDTGNNFGSGGSTSAPTLVSISVAPPSNMLAKGLSLQLSATGVYSDASHKDISAQVAWSSGDSSVVSINSAGMASAIAAGSTTLTATLGTVSGATPITVTAAALAAINITPTSTALPKGLVKAYTATGVYTDSTTQNLTAAATWDSSSVAVATVSNATGSNGMVTAVAPGSTTISAVYNGITGSTPLTVSGVALVSIAVTPATASMPALISQAFHATGTYSDNSTADLTSSATWSSSATAVATVSNTAGSVGTVTAVAAGMASITATVGGISGVAVVTVINATPVSITVTPASGSIAKGLTRQLTATATYSDNSSHDLTNQVTWSSANSSTVAVSNSSGFQGIVTAAALGGPISITATLGSVSGSTTVTVTAATLTSIGITPGNPTVANGSHLQFTATGTYSDNTNQDITTSVTWASSDPSIATISNAAGTQGYATALAAGPTTITAALSGVTSSPGSTLTVTAATLTSIAVTPASPTVAKGLTQQFTATATFSDGTTGNVTSSVTWTSGTPSVSTISNAGGSIGLAQAVDVGTSSITASSGTVFSPAVTFTVSAATLSGIAVTPASPTIANGTTQQFTATGTFSDSSTQNLTTSVTWMSSDPTVVSISSANGSQGLATSAGPGTATITATSGTVSNTSMLTVSNATLTSIAVSPAPASVYVGATQRFTATGTFSDNSTQDISTLVNWSSSQTTNATISNAGGSNGLATGVLLGTTSITATAFSVTSSTSVLTVRPQGFAYVANFGAHSVSAYGIGSNGALTLIGTYQTGNQPYAVAVDPTSQYLYVGNYADATISQFNIASDGSLSPMTSAATVAVRPSVNGLTVDPSGHYVYTANIDDNSVSLLTADMTGALTLTSTVSTGANTRPAGVTIDPLTKYLYVSLFATSQVAKFNIDNTGALSGLVTVAAAGAPATIVMDTRGQNVYALDYTANAVSQYAVANDGSLTPPGSSIATTTAPAGFALDPTGRYAYAGAGDVNGAAYVSQYGVNSDGTLAALSPVSVANGTGSQPSGVAVDPTGNYVYVVDRGSNVISQFQIGAGGVLSTLPSASPTTGASPTGIALTH